MTASQYLFDSDLVDFAVSVASVVSSQLFSHGRDRTPVRREGWNQQAVGVDDRLSEGQITVMIITASISHPDRAVLFVDRAGVKSLTGRTRTAAEQEFDGCELRQGGKPGEARSSTIDGVYHFTFVSMGRGHFSVQCREGWIGEGGQGYRIKGKGR